MDYICKECVHNNNGWCKKLKKQGLKQIFQCGDFSSESKSTSHTVDESLKMDFESSKVFGKRDMLYNMQRQIIAIEQKGMKQISIEELKNLMVSLNDIVNIEETLFGKHFDTLIDEDIYRDSVRISESWRNISK